MEGVTCCFNCLERRINSDFSDKLVFSYGLSDSAFPFSSSAVVQMANSNGEASASASQFILVQLPLRDHTCLSNYINEYIEEQSFQASENCENDGTALSDLNQDESNVSNVSIRKAIPDSSLHRSPCLLNADRIPSINLVGSLNSTCAHSSRLSCFRMITALAPFACIGLCSSSIFEELASDFISRIVEDHVVQSINLLIEGKASGRDAVNFFHLVGIPFNEISVPGCLRHPNMVPVLGMLKKTDCVYWVLPKTPYTLESFLHYCPYALKSEWHLRFLVYQLLSALTYLHNLGIPHGNICPSNVMVTDSCWSWLCMSDKPVPGSHISARECECNPPGPSARIKCCIDGCSYQGLFADLKLSQCIDWLSQFVQWWNGELSNFEYLLILNRLAGRRWGDHTFHTVMPWVIDFTTKPAEDSDLGWRDLSKSKWRLAKGDEQLDFTYSTSEIPHHVSDECLSELAVCSYKARRLPLSILRLAVRSVYEPNEYPSNMQRLYQWTPDECIPEFYCDPQIFYSLHSGMTDLAVPSWAGSPEEFIKLHREALESERVSRQIHHWIDIIFGYKMSGKAAISAKNVMLSSAESTVPRSVGRRQLFTLPHPPRRVVTKKLNELENETHVPSETAYLQQLEEASIFAEHAGDLSPQYCYDTFSTEDSSSLMSDKNISKPPIDVIRNSHMPSSDINLSYLLEHIEAEHEGSMGYQELLLWRQKSSSSTSLSEDVAKDIFSVGCVVAELYLKRPLFNSASLATYMESGILPASMQGVPSHARALVEACIQKDWTRRPSAKSILESPYFPATVKSSYLFIAPLQLIANDGSRLKYAANFAKNGALKAMGHFAAEMCAPSCLSLIMSSQSDTEAESAYILLKEFMKCLTPNAVKKLLMPIVQKILQTTGYSHLKLSLLQVSFVQELWNIIGKQTYLELLHPLVISNLYIAPHKSSAAVASVLLIGTSEELGVPITVNQTILPLIHCFGKGLCLDGIDVLVRIGGLFGDTFIVKQMLPLLKQVVHSCVSVSYTNRPEPVQSWSALALIDCLTTLDGLVAFLPREVIVKELIEDRNCIHVMVLMQTNFEISVLQVAASTLIAICQRIGPELTASYVLPQLKDLFNELAFSQETAGSSSSSGKSLKISKSKVDQETQIESRIDLVLLLYPSFASLLGIEKLRQCCATWLLLEQFLLRCHDWKWEHTGESSRSGTENIIAKRSPLNKNSAPEYSPAKLLLNGVGWSIPQSQGIRSGKNTMPIRRSDGLHQIPPENHLATSHFLKREPWFWFPSPAASWDGPEFLGRVGSLKDELPWKIRASVIYSIRAHRGALRSLAVSQDEGMVFTAGIGPGFKGTVQKWDLSRINCVSGYYGHEEAVNDVCVLPSTGKIASCDGTIHVWNGRTGKVVSVFSEPSVDSSHIGSPSSSVSKMNTDHPNMLNSSTMSSGLLANAFDGSLYTCMHHLESRQVLVVGTGNGCLRFIDVGQGQKLHLWKGESVNSAFPFLVSALCSCGSDKAAINGSSSSSWIAAGLSSGHCRLFDLRSGNVIASWRAHDGYVTKLAAPEDHLLVSSSLDKSLRIWDLRRSWSAKPTIVKGHADGISGFSLWGQDIISISRNKIGLSTLSRSADEDGQAQQIVPQKLYAAENGTKNTSVLSSINILPFSRLFVVGTEDGYLRICC